jgi:hypothetical protein
MKQTKIYTYYTILEISIMLGINQKSTRNRLSKLGIKKHKTNKKRLGLYTNEQVELLRGSKKLNDLSYEHLINERNQIPVVITYYIYESKMNT